MTDADTTILPENDQVEKPRQKRRPARKCGMEGCDDWVWARELCAVHYQRLRKLGGLPLVRKNIGDPNARFDASYEVNPATGCWEWTGWIHPKGYGILPIGSKKVRAHRFSYERFKGPIPEGMMILHACDNRKCSNPKHLAAGTGFDNMRDCVAKGRHHSRPGMEAFKITPHMALNIRIMFARGEHSMVELARIYGVEHATISGIVKGRSHL